MLSFSNEIKIFAYTPATDMRKGFNGLSGIIREEFHSDPTDGSLFSLLQNVSISSGSTERRSARALSVFL